MNTNIIILLFSILILFASSITTSVFGNALVTSYDIDRVVIELRKQFNAEHGCDYLDMKNLALLVEKGNNQTSLTEKCHIYYYDCMVSFNDDLKTSGYKNLTDLIDGKIKYGFPFERWCN